MPEPILITSGVIARRIGVPLHRVLRVLNTRAYIRPKARAGTLRLYDSQAIAMVRHALNAVEARRHGSRSALMPHPNQEVRS